MSLGDDSKRLADLIDSVADGRNVDWNAAGTSPTDARMRRLVEMLRIVDGIAEVHRSESVGPEAEARPEPRPNVGTDDPTRGTAGSIPTEGPLAQWGHFLLLQKLGEGAFGEVYHARDTWLEHSVALKLLKPPLVDRKRFLHEARTLAHIRHANVVAIHGADEHAGRLGFWMDFIEGHTLAEVVAREGVRSPLEAAVIGQDLCRAMAAVHATGIVHRDIKAQNVMRQIHTGHIILMDFGAGEAMDADRDGRRPTGTPLYLAPELFDGSVATRETDIYALGVLLFNLVTRSYPVHGESMGELLRAHRRNECHHLGDMRPDLPDSFVRVVETMLAPDPARRYHSATEARKALEEVVAPEVRFTHVAPPITVLQRVYRSVIVAGVVAIFFTTAGFFATGAMAVTFGRGEFGIESPSEWFIWGLRLMAAPVRYIGEYALEALGIVVAARVFCRLFPPMQRAAANVGGRCRRFLEERRLDDPNLLLQVTACLGALAFALLALYRWDDANIFAMFIDTAPPERLALLQPRNEPEFDVFSRLLEKILFAYGIAAAAVYSSVKRREIRISPVTRMCVIGVPVAALLLMRAVPYRMVYQNAFPRVDYGDMRCYDLGRGKGQVRLFCPDQDPAVMPRVMTKAVTDPMLHDRSITESIFTPGGTTGVPGITSP